MSDRIDIDAARAWLDSLPGGAIGGRLAESWQRFAATDVPVITVYGSYDTGKSSLIRRLLIELGQVVPPWLTISARHETFEVNEIRAGGCMLRDTPGFVVEGSDARAELNTELASEAIGLTDVAIVTVPPQLATAEYPVLSRLVQQDWTPGSLWFVISRFDEAGVDPDDDPDGYRELGTRKTAELQEALQLDPRVPVHVVCPDFAQMAGAERNADPSIWDDTREWDGIAGLLKAISEIAATGSNSELRHSAAQRFWRHAVEQALGQLRKELATHLENAVVSDEGDQRRASWLAQLETLTNAAEADLRGRVSAAIGDAMDAPEPGHGFGESLKTSIGAWHSACERDIDKLLHSVGDTISTERARPDWKQFEDLAWELRQGPPNSKAAEEQALKYSPVVRQVGDAVLIALRHYEESSGLKKLSKASSQAGAAPGSGRIAAAAAGIALLADLTAIAEQQANKQRAAERQRAELHSGLMAAGEQATTIGITALTSLVDHARQRIIDVTADQADLRQGLHRLVEELRGLVASGEALLAG